MPVNREQVVQAAEKLVAKGKIEAAIKEYRKVLEDSPSDTTTLNRVGDLWARLNKNDEAIKVYTQTAASFTEDGFFVKAIAIYKKVIKLDPTRLEVYEKLADLYHRQGLTNEARTQYQVLIDYYLKHSNAASAISILLKMVQLEPENPTHHVKLADIYKQQKLIDKAMGEYKVIAEMMLAKGHADEAAQVYLKALDVNANDMAFLTEAVLGLRDGGHIGPAARLLTAAVEKNPQAERVAALAGMRDKTGVHAPPSGARPSPLAASAPPPSIAALPEPPRIEPPPAFREVELPPLPGPESSTWNQPLGGDDSPAMPPIELDFELPVPEIEPAPEPEPPRPSGPPPREESFAGFGLDDEFVLDLDSDAPLPTEFRPPAIALPPPASASASIQAPQPPPSIPAPPLASPLPPSSIATPPPAVTPAPPPVAAAPAALVDWSRPGVPADSLEAKPFELDLDLELDDGGWAAEPAAAPSAPSTAVPASAAMPDLEVPQEIEWSFDGEAETAPAPPSGVRIDADFLERTAAEVQPSAVRRDEDLVAEAEVFAKYGLQEKAEERVREALQQNPRHAGAQALLIALMLQQGRHDRVVQLANHLAESAVTAGQHDTWAQTRQKLVKQGYRVEGDRVVAPPKAAPAEQDRIADLLGSIAQVPAAPPPVAAVPPAAKAPRSKRPEAALEDLASTFLKAPKPKAKPKPEPAAPSVAASAPVAAPPPPAVTPVPEPEFDEILPALDDELEGIVFPQEIAASQATPPASPPAAAPPAEASLSWLDEIPAAAPGAAAAEEKLFDDEEDFFDLAAELERELVEDDGSRGTPQPGAAPQEQSLEEIVEGFKKGVAENLSPEDYDTHFNLGIAYREMGLLDEAIGEFQLASKDIEHLVECCSMLGICFLDKGLPELAVKWYKRGLEVPNLIEDRQLGLLYDMGNALALAGDRDAAYKTFVEIYGINSNYRDIVAILQELGPR